MRPLLASICLLIASACAPTPFVYKSDCVTFNSHVELKQDKVDIYVSKAKEIFDRRFYNGSFCDTVRDAHIVVRTDTKWKCSPTVTCNGYMGPINEIELSQWGNAFVHEVIHMYEARRWITGTGDHEHWQELGYHDMSNEFERHISSEEIQWWQ